MKRSWSQKGQYLIHDIQNSAPAENEVFAWYIGQVGLVLKGKETVCIDPFLNDLTDECGNSLRLYESGLPAGELKPDYVICTHGHEDHLALPTIMEIAASEDKTKFIVPGACIEQLTQNGIPQERIMEMRTDQVIKTGGIKIRPIRASHPVEETDRIGREKAVCLSMEISGVRVMHLGDTYLTHTLLQALKNEERPDVLFLPINGGDYFRTSRNCIGNLNAQEAAKLASILNARVCVPTHFDAIKGNTADPFEFVRLLWEENPAARISLPALGERLFFRREEESTSA